MRMIKFIVIVFILLFFSCDNEEIQRVYYDNDTLKEERIYINKELKKKFEFDSLGVIRKKVFYSRGELDSLIVFDTDGYKESKRLFIANNIYEKCYFKNGKTESEGSITKDSLSVGWWTFYYKNGLLKAKREYFIVCGKSVLNQSVAFESKGDTIFKDDFNESSFYDFKVTDLKNGKLKVDYHIVPLSNRSFLQLGIINKDDFCIIEEKDIDTAINLTSRKGVFIINQNKYNKGMIVDYRTKEKGVELNEGVSTLSRKMYFDLDDYIVEKPSK